MPSSHRAHAEWTPSRLIRWAEKIGADTGRLVAEVLQRRPHPEQGYRSCLGLMRLGRRYGPERLEAASTRSLRLRSYSYRTVKNILSAKFGKTTIKAVARTKTGSFMVATSPTCKGRSFSFPK